MAPPLILLEQAGTPPGVPKQSRRDFAVGIPVNVSDFANPTGVFLWELVSPPLSFAVLDDVTSPTPTFTPDVTGPYILFVTVNSLEFSFWLDANGNKISDQGGAGVELPNTTLSHGIGESKQFNLLGYGKRFDELFPFFDKLRGGIDGWIRIVDITVPGGSTANEVYQDAPGNTILQSIDVSDGTFDVTVEASFPLVDIGGFTGTLPLVGSIYRGSVSVTLGADGPIEARVISPDNTVGSKDTVAIVIDTPPQLLTFEFVGGYPGSQTELKAGDTFQVQGTTDKPCDAIEVQSLGASDAVQLLTFASTTSFLVSIVIGDRGTTLQALAATARARSVTTGALGAARATNELGGVVDGTNLVNLNNLFPSVAIGAITYPGGQQALKGAESATIVNTASDYDTIAYNSPGAELSIINGATHEDPKSVSRIGGSYNVSVSNFLIAATRNANAAVTIEQAVVNIANVAAIVGVTEPATRLRSGGNDGTAPQDHTITISSDQELIAAPTLTPDLGGSRGSFLGLFVGGPLLWTAQLRVLDTDEKGVFAWGAMLATNLAGTPTVVITGDSNYELGGFVARTLTFAAFATTSAMNVEVVDFAKLQAGIFTSTNQPALKQAIGTLPSVTDGFTIDSLGINPTDVIWLDTPAAGANSGGTATITDVEETV